MCDVLCVCVCVCVCVLTTEAVRMVCVCVCVCVCVWVCVVVHTSVMLTEDPPSLLSRAVRMRASLWPAGSGAWCSWCLLTDGQMTDGLQRAWQVPRCQAH